VVEHSALARLLALAESAVSAVSAAIEHGDARVSLSVMKGLGLLTKLSHGPDNPEHVQETMEIDELTRQANQAVLKSAAIMKKMAMGAT
jgi:hypothetical protein